MGIEETLIRCSWIFASAWVIVTVIKEFKSWD
jgi:hypothetical protein